MHEQLTGPEATVGPKTGEPVGMDRDCQDSKLSLGVCGESERERGWGQNHYFVRPTFELFLRDGVGCKWDFPIRALIIDAILRGTGSRCPCCADGGDVQALSACGRVRKVVV